MQRSIESILDVWPLPVTLQVFSSSRVERFDRRQIECLGGNLAAVVAMKFANESISANVRQLMAIARRTLHHAVSLLLVDNRELKKLPRTYISTVDHDRLRDESFIYAGRLKKNEVNVLHGSFETTCHRSLIFLGSGFRLNIAHEMMEKLVCNQRIWPRRTIVHGILKRETKWKEKSMDKASSVQITSFHISEKDFVFHSLIGFYEINQTMIRCLSHPI